ncbi:hypothetical protein MMC11_008344 [Xylographa trunciseda]|nr:hypothetical protein [Xylographa trunciseda]
MLYQGAEWKDIDGKCLEFLTPSRPARRYLYFRYIITYLHHKKEGTLVWVEDVEARGNMWAAPGPYIRRSMLVSLARKVLDHDLPEDLYKENTFEQVEADESTARPQEEPGMVLSLACRLKDEEEAAIYKETRDCYSESEDDDDEDDWST